jgi:hypothetical protein
VSAEGLAVLVREEIQADPFSGAVSVFRAKTCKLCGVEPQSYITDVITKMVDGHSNSQFDVLLPWPYPRNSRTLRACRSTRPRRCGISLRCSSPR